MVKVSVFHMKICTSDLVRMDHVKSLIISEDKFDSVSALFSRIHFVAGYKDNI